MGYAWNNVLLYLKGGAALVDNKYNTDCVNTGIYCANRLLKKALARLVPGLGLDDGAFADQVRLTGRHYVASSSLAIRTRL